MRAISPKYTQVEFAKRGETLFEVSVKPLIPVGHDQDFVLIDIESGEFEYDPNQLTATARLKARRPNAQIWVRKVGTQYSRCYQAPRRDARR